MNSSPAHGKTIKDFDLRRKSGATILTVIRGKTPHTNPHPEFKILEGDLLVMLGSHAQLECADRLLSPTPKET